jgi:adenylate kinase family enzyme
MRRVLVIGCSGAGKSTFCERLAALTGLSILALDGAFWRSGWVETPREEWRACVQRLTAGEAWIMDGTFVGTLDIRLPRADTVVWLDPPRRVCMARVLWRIASSYGRVRPEMAAGCPERFDGGFLRYVWTFNASYRPHIETALTAYGRHLSPVIIRHDADAARFLDKIGREKPSEAD